VDDPGRLSAVVAFLERVAGRVPVVFPVHPRTRARLEGAGLDARLDASPQMRRCSPLSYRESLGLMAGARVVITDSGGVQEETTFLGVPCITLRPNTERPVTERLGTNTVVGSDLERAWAVTEEALDGRIQDPQPIPGWDGRAAERIAEVLASRYGEGDG
jgi:UDP-N-acetylglucosamine 2-epimerase (non-hydrolysing)